MYGHDYSNQRFSPVQINSTNVSRLTPAYVVQTGILGPFEHAHRLQRRNVYHDLVRRCLWIDALTLPRS